MRLHAIYWNGNNAFEVKEFVDNMSLLWGMPRNFFEVEKIGSVLFINDSGYNYEIKIEKGRYIAATLDPSKSPMPFYKITEHQKIKEHLPASPSIDEIRAHKILNDHRPPNTILVKNSAFEGALNILSD
jgi:hypothetical protein